MYGSVFGQFSLSMRAYGEVYGLDAVACFPTLGAKPTYTAKTCVEGVSRH